MKRRNEWTKIKIGFPKTTGCFEIKAWCEEHFGKTWGVDNQSGVWQILWSGRDSPHDYDAFFANDEDAVLFSLKWL